MSRWYQWGDCRGLATCSWFRWLYGPADHRAETVTGGSTVVAPGTKALYIGGHEVKRAMGRGCGVAVAVSERGEW